MKVVLCLPPKIIRLSCFQLTCDLSTNRELQLTMRSISVCLSSEHVSSVRAVVNAIVTDAISTTSARKPHPIVLAIANSKAGRLCVSAKPLSPLADCLTEDGALFGATRIVMCPINWTEWDDRLPVLERLLLHTPTTEYD